MSNYSPFRIVDCPKHRKAKVRVKNFTQKVQEIGVSSADPLLSSEVQSRLLYLITLDPRLSEFMERLIGSFNGKQLKLEQLLVFLKGYRYRPPIELFKGVQDELCDIIQNRVCIEQLLEETYCSHRQAVYEFGLPKRSEVTFSFSRPNSGPLGQISGDSTLFGSRPISKPPESEVLEEASGVTVESVDESTPSQISESVEDEVCDLLDKAALECSVMRAVPHESKLPRVKKKPISLSDHRVPPISS